MTWIEIYGAPGRFQMAETKNEKKNEENKLALLPLFSDGSPKYDPAAKYLGSEVYVVHSNNGGRTLR